MFRLKPRKAARSAWSKNGDMIEIDIPNRTIHLAVPDNVLAARRAAQEARGEAALTPVTRKRKVSEALKAYAAFTTSAAKGAVRDVAGGLKRGR